MVNKIIILFCFIKKKQMLIAREVNGAKKPNVIEKQPATYNNSNNRNHANGNS